MDWRFWQFATVLIVLSQISAWTEEDEDERISMLMNAERKAFEREMGIQQRERNKNRDNDDIQDMYIQTDTRREHHHHRTQYNRKDKEPYKSTQQVYKSAPEQQGLVSEYWCYHCVSPLSGLSSDMKKTIQQFLKVRRTSYPKEVATKECISSRNMSALSKQYCKHSYCQTVALVDHEKGNSFVLRGCAENFGATDLKLWEEQVAHTCSKIHDQLDMKECICRNKQYCSAGKNHPINHSKHIYSFLNILNSLTFLFLVIGV